MKVKNQLAEYIFLKSQIRYVANTFQFVSICLFNPELLNKKQKFLKKNIKDEIGFDEIRLCLITQNESFLAFP